MPYDPELPGCFGNNDCLLAVHPSDEDRAFAWLTKLRQREATWGEARDQVAEFLQERGCSSSHIEKQVERAKHLFGPWLSGPIDDENEVPGVAHVTAIQRTDRPDRADWVPVQTQKGYQLTSRDIPFPQRNHTDHATFVSSLEEAGELVEKGYAIRMAAPGASWGDYIYPENLKVVRA